METKAYLPRRTYSVGTEDSLNVSFMAKNREIVNAINNRNTSSLLNVSFTKGTIVTSPREEPFDSSIQLRMLKNTIDSQRLVTGKGDKTISVLRQELKQLDLEEARQNFWHKMNLQKSKDLQAMVEEAVRRQGEEIVNQEIYYHLLKRMKKTKIFLEIRAGVLNDNLKVSESVLSEEKKKYLVSKESAMQAKIACKDFEKAIKMEKDEGESQITNLKVSIDKNLEITDRRENWKKHRETMFEAAVIEDRSAKNLSIKEGLSLHRLWYSVLTKIFEKKKEKSQKLEEAFQKIKIATGLPDINQIVENFLTKEQTYEALMLTVNKKEVECSNYKSKIDQLQAGVNNYANRSVSNKNELDEQREIQESKIRDLLELSQKKFLIENTYSKVRTWMKLMIRKFYKIVGGTREELKGEENLLYYLEIIRDILKNAKNNRENELGKTVEDNRKMAVYSMIKHISKIPHTFAEEEVMNENSLVATDNDLDEKGNMRPY